MKKKLSSTVLGSTSPTDRLVASIDWHGSSDEDLGRLLITVRLSAEAEQHCRTPQEIMRWIELHGPAKIEAIGKQETDKVTDMPLEKALRLACNGEFARAGAIWRAYMLDMGKRMHEGKHAALHVAQQVKLLQSGMKGGEARRKYTDADREQWCELAAGADLAQHSTLRRAELIAARFGLPKSAVETIRRVIAQK
ncbi:MAG: hypothetical protein QM750_11975 [Rubrivivax sp.]